VLFDMMVSEDACLPCKAVQGCARLAFGNGFSRKNGSH
jgi:hypothetical protein